MNKSKRLGSVTSPGLPSATTHLPKPTPGHSPLAAAVAIIAAFCASACLFLIELFAGKLLLPRFGGAPGVWVSCLAFFQLALVAAYFYSDRVIRFVPTGWQVLGQGGVFVAAAVAAACGLGQACDAGGLSRMPLPMAVILLLAAMVGPAFFAIATLAPLFGHWRSLWPDDGRGSTTAGHRNAYSLYAAGNAGSFAMLIGYPLAIEPVAGLARQADIMATLYGLVAILAIACGWYAATRPRQPAAGGTPEPAAARRLDAPVGWKRWLRWVLLAAIPASWLASITTHATVEVAPMPLLWIMPLAIYLASFIVVFSPLGRSLRRLEPPALFAAVATATWLLASKIDEPVWLVLCGQMLIFLVICTALHGMLVDERLPPGQLTSMYLAMAVGGACGGLWNALVAPMIFDAHYEFPLAIAAVAGSMPGVRENIMGRSRWMAAGVTASLLFGASGLVPGLHVPPLAWLALLAFATFVMLFVLQGWEWAAAVTLLLLGTFWIGEDIDDVIHRERTFFGVLRVCDDTNGPSRKLVHGNICHGVQLVSDDPERRRIPLSYYHQTGPLGSVFKTLAGQHEIRRVGVAGLGIGTIAAYAQPEQEFVFFEIDPAVVRIANNPGWFTYLADCRATQRIVVDDARVALRRELDKSFDLLVIDAFTGDSVPTHLLTREALSLYGRKVSDTGVVAFHISNKYLDFAPIVAALAADGGWLALDGHDLEVPADYARIASHWMVLSRSLDVIQAIYVSPTSDRWSWKPAAEKPASRPWTDDRHAVADAL